EGRRFKSGSRNQTTEKATLKKVAFFASAFQLISPPPERPSPLRQYETSLTILKVLSGPIISDITLPKGLVL
ncbi:MAG: hypothetical protein ACN6QI_24925, partial [Pseudomonas sp.]|uniref:hypothetical protein n=1 Tax=Pseudomonas sp. TaxID=306 RepID=UPI003D0B9B8E